MNTGDGRCAPGHAKQIRENASTLVPALPLPPAFSPFNPPAFFGQPPVGCPPIPAPAAGLPVCPLRLTTLRGYAWGASIVLCRKALLQGRGPTVGKSLGQVWASLPPLPALALSLPPFPALRKFRWRAPSFIPNSSKFGQCRAACQADRQGFADKLVLSRQFLTPGRGALAALL